MKKEYTVIDKAGPCGQSVAYNGIPCTAKRCVTELNRLLQENKELHTKLRKKHKLKIVGYIFEEGGVKYDWLFDEH